MNPDNQISGAFWIMVVLQTMGSVDMPGSGERKMPAPRSYVAIIVMFSTLHIIADAGFGKAATVMAWVTVLTGMVVGPFGTRLTNFYNTVATQFAVAPSPTTLPPSVPYPTPIQPEAVSQAAPSTPYPSPISPTSPQVG